jgi:hypothetical protein
MSKETITALAIFAIFAALGIATVVPILQIADARRHFPVPDCNAIGTPRFDDVDCNAHGPRH